MHGFQFQRQSTGLDRCRANVRRQRRWDGSRRLLRSGSRRSRRAERAVVPARCSRLPAFRIEGLVRIPPLPAPAPGRHAAVRTPCPALPPDAARWPHRRGSARACVGRPGSGRAASISPPGGSTSAWPFNLAARCRAQRLASQPSRRAASSASSKITATAGSCSTLSKRDRLSSMAASSATSTTCGEASPRACCLQGVGIVLEHDFGTRFVKRQAQLLARGAGPGQQRDALAWLHRLQAGIIRGHGRSPAGRRRCASNPVPGTACPCSAARRSPWRAGDACRRYAR